MNSTIPRLIVADMDVGVDDALALFFILKASLVLTGIASTKLLAITAVSGNTNVDNVTHNVLSVLQVAKRNDIPVYRGANNPIIDDLPPLSKIGYFGLNGLGDVPVDPEQNSSIPEHLLRDEHAVSALNRLVAQDHPGGQVTLLCTGPLTNIALAIRIYGDEFVRNVRDVFIMGGNYQGVGNVEQRIGAEFNFYADPEAASIVLESFGKAGVPITLLPWEACERFTLPWSWRTDVWGKIVSPVTQFMNPIDASIQKLHNSDVYGHCDAIATAALLFPELIVKGYIRRLCIVERQGLHTRGALVLNYASKNEGQWVQIIENADVDGFKNVMLWAVK